MKHLKFLPVLFGLALTVMSCENNSTDTSLESRGGNTEMETTEPDMNQLKAEIQERETAFAQADNARDAEAISNFYAEDAITLEADKPMTVGRPAIKKSIEEYLSKRPEGSTVKYEVVDIYGGGQYATEVGKTTRMDSTGKVTSTGKYMAVWEKRDGQWVCIRDMANDDQKMN